MSIAARVKRFLNENRVSYQILNYERTYSLSEAIETLKIPAHEVLKAIPITDGFTTLLAILPWSYEIDYIGIELELKGHFQAVPPDKYPLLFCDCEANCLPPLGEAYELRVILDKTIEKLETVYIETGSYSALLQMSVDDFRFLNGGAPVFSFAYPNTAKYSDTIAIQHHAKSNNVAEIFPALPILAQKILNIAETLMTKHRSPVLKTESRLFKFADFDHVALALATHQVFKLPQELFLGSKVFWKHALYAASLAESLAAKLNLSAELDPELCYLLGFTHNFGFLLFGHLFLHEFRLLSKWIEQNPSEPIECLERRLLGMGKGANMVRRGHTELGAWLMGYWNMPEVFVCVAEYHHAAEYEGPYVHHIALIQLVNQLLNTVGIGKETLSVPIEKNLKLLDLDLEAGERILADLMAGPTDLRLEEMALHLAS